VTLLARLGSKYMNKLQTHHIISNGAKREQICKGPIVIKFWSWALGGAGNEDEIAK
jgi:hypothetical protein